MKQKLMALAVLAAIGGSAHAQSSVTLYGIADAFVEVANNGNSNTARVSSGGAYGSRLGFKGVEDLGDGLKTIFNLEAGILIDTGAGTGTVVAPTSNTPTGGSYIFQRMAFVGLSGGFGTLTAGRQYTPHFILMASTDPSGMTMSGAMNYFAGPGAGGINGGGPADATTRRDNSLLYTTPVMGGFKASLMYALGESSTDPKTLGNTIDIAGAYNNGALAVQLSYLEEKTVHDTVGTTLNTDKYTALGAAYDFGPVKPSLIYIQRRGELAAAPDLDAYQLGASAPLGNGKLIATYGHMKNKTVDGANATAWGLRYDYSLSKRTTWYVGATAISNDAHAGYTISGGGGSSAGLALYNPTGVAGGGNGQDPHNIYTGIAHFF